MQPLAWYLNRLGAMSPNEVLSRGLRQIRLEAERLGLLRADRRLSKPAWPPPVKAAPRRVPDIGDPSAYLAAADEIRRGHFELFGSRFRLGEVPLWNVNPRCGTKAPLTFGKSLDYRDSRLAGDVKYIWELNRHLELVPLAQAYAISGDMRYLDTLRAFVSSWIEQCPYPLGVQWCSSLELGIRLINWQLAYEYAGGADSILFQGREGEAFLRSWLDTIYLHADFIMGHLSTHSSSANNHLIGELSGVFVAACTWPCWPQMNRWRERAKRLLCREVERQTYLDGVNKEQAVWYQQFVFSFSVVAGIAGQKCGVVFPNSYWATLARMVDFVSSIMDVSGNVPMIGDADDGLVYLMEPRAGFDPFRSMVAVGAALFDSERWRRLSKGHDETARWLCDSVKPVRTDVRTEELTRVFPQGGYYVLGRHLDTNDEVRILVDAGALGFQSIAAHGHADCLSITLSIAGQEQLIDPGTYSYHTDQAWRSYFRGTAAHNTVRIDELDQSEIGGPFLWRTQAGAEVEAFDSSDDEDYVRARQSGYLRLSDPVDLVREVRFSKGSMLLEIVDHIRCDAGHVVERFWHFAEGCHVEVDKLSATSVDRTVELHIEVDEPNTTASLTRGGTAPIAGWVSRHLGEKAPSYTLVFRSRVTGNTALRTSIRMYVARQA